MFYFDKINEKRILKSDFIKNSQAFFTTRDICICDKGTGVNDNSAIVMKESSILKSSPTENSNDLYVLHAGSRIKILDKSMEKWCEVKFGDDKEGWINKDDIEII